MASIVVGISARAVDEFVLCNADEFQNDRPKRSFGEKLEGSTFLLETYIYIYIFMTSLVVPTYGHTNRAVNVSATDLQK